jgi:hypothetical protein
MSRIERIDAGKTLIFNVEGKVGRNAFNLPGDVIVVQTLFKYYREEGYHDFAPSTSAMRAPDGVYAPVVDPLDNLIETYQNYVNNTFSPYIHRNLLAVDGVISRAKGKSFYGADKRYTIANLNQNCQRIFMSKTGGDNEGYINDVLTKYPQLTYWLVSRTPPEILKVA